MFQKLINYRKYLVIGLFTVSLSGLSHAGQVRVAVASNFLIPLKSIANDFQEHTGNSLRISSGSTGKLYAQIVNGAPFDVFLAANSREPQRLEEAGIVVQGSRFTYAMGQLALWGQGLNADNKKLKDILTASTWQRLSLANPKTAPYGMAAVEVIKKLGIYDELKPRLIRGENISQAYQYVASGAAQLGFVALSQIRTQGKPGTKVGQYYWKVDQSLYSPIRQQAVLLKGAEQNTAAQQFMAYLKSPQGRAMIVASDYRVEAR